MDATTGDGATHRRRRASRRHPGVGRRAGGDPRTAQRGHRGRASDPGGVQPADGPRYRGQDPGRARRPRGGSSVGRRRGRQHSRRARPGPAVVAHLAHRRSKGLRVMADGAQCHRGEPGKPASGFALDTRTEFTVDPDAALMSAGGDHVRRWHRLGLAERRRGDALCGFPGAGDLRAGTDVHADGACPRGCDCLADRAARRVI